MIRNTTVLTKSKEYMYGLKEWSGWNWVRIGFNVNTVMNMYE